jgi:hypothetical protein
MPEQTQQLPNVENLHVDAINVIPIGYDWGEHEQGEDYETYPPVVGDMDLREKFEFMDDHGHGYDGMNPLVATSEELDIFIRSHKLYKGWKEECPDSDDPDVVLSAKRDFVLQALEDDETLVAVDEVDGIVEDLIRESEMCQPMMNYYYPAPKLVGDLGKQNSRLQHLPVCLVRVDGDPALALTGGGMDLTWQICEAYMRLGFLPPFHFARDLPLMAGMSMANPVTAWVWAGCKRTCEIMSNWAKRSVERLGEVRGWIERQPH